MFGHALPSQIFLSSYESLLVALVFSASADHSCSHAEQLVPCSGVVDLDEFFEYLCEEKTPFAEQLFTLIDENASGELDFNEFLVGLWNICTFEKDSLLRFAFDLVDKDGSGYIDMDEMEVTD